jgi:uncharacterized protein YggU (UPF0235/DUF167 family)
MSGLKLLRLVVRRRKGRCERVVDFKINTTKGNRSVGVEALVQICQVRNKHLEIVKGEYSHLKDLWLSDMCKSNDVLVVMVIKY